MSTGTEVWIVWAYIAIEQAGLAQRGRAALAADLQARRPLEMDAELFGSMVATTAVAASLDGFERVIRNDCKVSVAKPEGKKTTRAHWIWEALRAGFAVGSKTNVWPRQIKDVFRLRNGQVHPKTVFGHPVQHPIIPGVTPARALYTTEAADEAVALMRDIYRTCREVVRPEHSALVTRMSGLDGSLRKISP
jgi:hypothetical protein